ncbi:MAG: hypothetical protein COW03_11465 [Cytophagales bacterium CG12_big_fil_rev_8_21_14_0_65_40_12]|nr:MAG: hypothetical protein COW03_11465 [Cytophagales bacterium CG12_big_fil_rev_8_21_14_0_65_40_12]PIW03355.1 MAG: hypothetical protein COW40_15210 [Cytophagales bacterium CG17_big_fil_post_rev_8_21_14_2_50_40_13]
MTEQELRNIWTNASQVEKIQVDLSRLVIDLKNKLDHIEKAIRNRDLREIIAAFIGVPIFAYFAYEIPFPITRIASLLTVVWSIYVIYRFRKLQKSRKTEDLTLPFKSQLENQKTNMMAEHRFLDTVLYWYAGPPFLLNTLFILGLGKAESLSDPSWIIAHLPLNMNEKIPLIIGLACFYTFIVWLNKKAVKKTINPLIAEIDRIQQQLETED